MDLVHLYYERFLGGCQEENDKISTIGQNDDDKLVVLHKIRLSLTASTGLCYTESGIKGGYGR